MQRRFWRGISLKRGRTVLWLLGVGFAVWAIAEVGATAWYGSLVRQYGGHLVLQPRFPPRVSVEFQTNDLGENSPADDLQPVLRKLRLWGAVTKLAVERVDDAEFEEITGFPKLRSLHMTLPTVSDTNWPELGRNVALLDLGLGRYTKITPAAARSIAGLTHLRSLDLHDCELTAAGLRFVADLRELESMALCAIWPGGARRRRSGGHRCPSRLT